MILSDRSIRYRMREEDSRYRIVIDPMPGDECFQPASVDLRLAGEWSASGFTYTGNTFELGSGGTVLGTTLETVHIPIDLVGQVWGKSSRAREFLLIHCTAGYIDPNFSGQITLELVNLGKKPFLLKAGMKIAQINFTLLNGAVERPYGSPELGNHYQFQQGVTPNRDGAS